MHLLALTLYVCGPLGKLDAKAHEKFWYVQVQVSRTWACPVIKILSKNDRLHALLQLFVAVGCRNASYHQERCFCFPYLRRKEVSLSSFYELIEGLPLSATATGKSLSHSEVPVVRGSRGCRFTSELLRSRRHLRSDSAVNSADLVSMTTSLVFAGHFSLIVNSFILNFNKWVTHSSAMPQVLCHKFVFFCIV